MRSNSLPHIQNGPGRFDPYQPTGKRLRLASRAINEGLMGIWRGVTRAEMAGTVAASFQES
jgi:hypothetical protein